MKKITTDKVRNAFNEYVKGKTQDEIITSLIYHSDLNLFDNGATLTDDEYKDYYSQVDNKSSEGKEIIRKFLIELFSTN